MTHRRRVRSVLTTIVLATTAAAACVPQAPVDTWMSPGKCWDGIEVLDLQYLGPVDTVANYQLFETRDGTCGGEPFTTDFGTIRADGFDAAMRRCEELTGTTPDRTYVEPLTLAIPTAEPDAWSCPMASLAG